MSELDSFVKKFTTEKINYVQRGKKFYLVIDEVLEVEKSISGVSSLGIILGEIGDHNFKPSLYLLEILSKTSTNKIFVNDKAEWLFLCGRDVLPEGIVKDDSTNELFLIQNSKDENLGFAKRVKDKKKFFLKNILDRGNFLRRERY
jgi:ribosome biogenesis protein Nip4